VTTTDAPIALADLRASYASYGASRDRWLVGGEFERAAVHPDGSAVSYHEPLGVRWMLETLRARTGWTRVDEDGNPIELRAPSSATVTLEPGGQVEWSGAPFRMIGDLAAEVRGNRQQLLDLAEAGTRDGHPFRWIACGLTPAQRIGEIEFVPKGRYRVMREYLPRHGDLAHWMMKGTCSVQANYDFGDEADCARKFHLALDLAPLTVALFANSPLAEGKPTGMMSTRGNVWTRVDPARSGFPANVRAAYSHEAWIQYLLDVPMMFFKRDGQWSPAHGMTFRQWMDRGDDGRFPSAADWALHQTSVFPEVRVKRTIEIRGADAVGIDGAIAFCALWKGLLYDDGSLSEARILADEFLSGPRRGEIHPHETLHADASLQGLRAGASGRTFAAWAGDLVAIAARGLRALGEPDGWLDPLAHWAERGRSPAEDVLRAYERGGMPAVLDAVAY
jgi:glutamate--cysteine ligase